MNARLQMRGLVRRASVLLGLSLLGSASIQGSPLLACDLRVCPNPRSEQSPFVVSDGYGGAIVVWSDNRNGSAYSPDIFAQHIVSGLGIDPAWPVNGAPVTQAIEEQSSFDVAADGTGGIYVVWADFRNAVITHPGYDIYAQHLTATGAVAQGWPADGLPICTATSDQTMAHVTSDGVGGAIFVWEDHRLGGSGDDSIAGIYALRVNADGSLAPGWSVDGNPVVSVPGGQIHPGIVGVNGDVIVAWVDGRNQAVTGGDVYASRITGAGTIAAGWPADGVVLSAVPGPQGAYLRLVPDGAGGAIVAWEDNRYPSAQGGDIYAQRVMASGEIAPGWPANGLPLSTAPNEQSFPHMISDGGGGALVIWDDYRNDVDTYGQHVLGDGTIAPGWQANGNLVATGLGGQMFGSLAPDGAGGMFVAYENYASTTSVYAQHMLANGSLAPGWPATGRAICDFGGQDDEPSVVTDGSGGAIVAYHEQYPPLNNHIFASWVPRDLPVATMLALVSADVSAGSVQLKWFGEQAAGTSASVERRTEQADWATISAVTADGSGTFLYDDRSVQAGQRYAYRLRYHSGFLDVFTEEKWVDVPKPVLALDGLSPNPSAGACFASFSLDGDSPALLEMFDVAGRRVVARDVTGLGAGAQRLRIDDGARFAPGVYTLRLTQAGVSKTARAVVTR